MKMSEAQKGLRVRLCDTQQQHWKGFIERGWRSVRGTLTSGRILRQRPGTEEGLYVRVKWDGMPTPERWHLTDLVRISPLRSDAVAERPAGPPVTPHQEKP